MSKLLVSLSEDIVKDLKQALVDRNINTSSLGLSQSIHVNEINFKGETLSVGISADFYWKYVNYGVNGTEINRGAPDWGPSPPGEMSFAESIRKWIPQRGIIPEPDEITGITPTYDQLTYMIMSKIKRDGKAARPFFEDVVNDTLVAKLREPVEAVIGRAIEIAIISPWQ